MYLLKQALLECSETKPSMTTNNDAMLRCTCLSRHFWNVQKPNLYLILELLEKKYSKSMITVMLCWDAPM